MTRKAKGLLPKRLGFFSKGIIIANTLAVVSLLLSYSASIINPQLFWPIAFFGLAFLPILIINLIFVGYWFFRKKRYMLISLLPILLGWNLLSKHITFQNNNERIVYKADSSLRVMSFNVQLFKKYEDPQTDFREEAQEIIRSIKPDIICFQEFYSRLRGSQQFSNTIKEEGDFEAYYFEPFLANDYEGFGSAIFSKNPIINQGTIDQHGYGINRIIYADIKREADTLRVYNVHLRSFALQDEDKEFVVQTANNMQISDEEGPRRLRKKLKEAFTRRTDQAKALKSHMEACPFPYIVVGDFNDTPMSYSVNLIASNMNNAFLEQGFGWGVTHFGLLPIFQIDYIFTDKRLQVDNYGIIKERLSDHYPIWADLSYLSSYQSSHQPLQD